MKSWYWFLTAGFLSLSVAGCNVSLPFTKNEKALTPGEISQQVKQGLVLLNYETKSGHGSGFFVPGSKEVCTVLTAGHVLPTNDTMVVQTHDRKAWKTTDVRRLIDQDLAIVTFKPEAENCPYLPLTLGNSNSVKVGEPIYIAGFPQSSVAQFVDNLVAGEITARGKLPEGYGISYQATVEGVKSGGPVLDATGQVIAVHGRSDTEMAKIVELAGGQMPVQQSTSADLPALGVPLSTFKWGIPINTYLANQSRTSTEVVTNKTPPKKPKGNIVVSPSPSVTPVAKTNPLKRLQDRWKAIIDSSNAQLYEQRLAVSDQAITLKPDDPKAWHDRGLLLAEFKQYEKGLEAYDQAISLDPKFAKAWHDRGWLLSELEQYKKALEAYDQAISLDPKYVNAWYGRGVLLGEKFRQYEKALEAYDQAISLDPKYANAWYGRGRVLMELYQYDQALASYEKVTALKPKYADAWYGRGRAFMKLYQYDQALVAYEKVIALKPKYANAWSERGKALEKLQRGDEALKSYEKAIQLDPNNLLAIYRHKQFLRKLGRSNP